MGVAMSVQPPKMPRVTHPETKPATLIEVVETAEQLRRFREVTGYVYWHDPYYVPRLASEETRFLDEKKNPFFRHGEARLFVARHGQQKPVARVSAAIDRDFDAQHGKTYGFFGFWEYLSDARLPADTLAAAVAWLREKGAEEIIGPCSFTPAHPFPGMLIDGFDDDPTLQTTYSTVNHFGHTGRLPLEKWRDLFGYELSLGPAPERLRAAAERVAARRGLTVRPLDSTRLEQELEVIRAVHDEAWKGTPAYVPLGTEDLRFLAAALGPAFDPGLWLILEEKGTPVGISVSVPDWNRVLKHQGGRTLPFGWLKALLVRRTIDRARVMFFGVAGAARRPGAAAPLALATWEALERRGYRRVDLSCIYEDDRRALALASKLGARRTRTWRLFRVVS
jgi:hypothetical protein